MQYAKQPLPSPLTPSGLNGYMVRNLRASGFKLAIVVGWTITPGKGDRARVRFWRAASKCWTQPTLCDPAHLQALTDDERRDRRRLIDAASSAASSFVSRSWS